jgi:hypothetical protein
MIAPGVVGIANLFKQPDNRIFDTIKVEQCIHKHFTIYSGLRGRYVIQEVNADDETGRTIDQFQISYSDMGIHVRSHAAIPSTHQKARARMILAQMKEAAKV